MNIIKQKVPVTELLAGLAEEASELAQAALKLRRVYDGTNPTPVKEEDAQERLYEEMADVKLYCSMLKVNVKYISEMMLSKHKRWEQRLMEDEK
jgi:NTP pyrophosphatase (non-canonical NTP hydrolase)